MLLLNFSISKGQDYLSISRSESFESATLKLIKLGFEHKNSIKDNNYNYLRRKDNSRGITELAILINFNEIKLGNELYVVSVIDEGVNKEYFFDKISNELKSKFGVSERFKVREYIYFENGISFSQYEDKRDNYNNKNLLYLLSLPNPGLSKMSHMGSRNAVDIAISEILLFDNSNFQRGFKMLQEKNYYEAVRLFSGSIDIIDNRMYSYIFRGWAKAMLEDKYGGIEDLNKAFELMKSVEKKENADLYYYKGLIHTMRGEDFEGCKCLSKAGELGESKAYNAIQKFCK
jgi:hypothetical protein